MTKVKEFFPSRASGSNDHFIKKKERSDTLTLGISKFSSL